MKNSITLIQYLILCVSAINALKGNIDIALAGLVIYETGNLIKKSKD